MRVLPVALAAAFAALAAAGSEAGGLFSRKHDADAQPAATSQPPQDFDCSQLATMQYAAMSMEQCQAMKAMAQNAQTSMNDPAGVRPGDERMSCADIEAEMRTMNGVGVSDQHRAQGEAAKQEFQATAAKQRAEATALAAKESAEVSAAAAADTATELATGGLVRGRATEAVTRKSLDEQKVVGERMAKEMAPKEQAVFGAVINSGGDMNQSMQSNPRFARLMKLAMDKQCRG
jgi:hypothetical protein